MKVGIVGVGDICRYHIQALKEVGKIEVVGICDLDIARAEDMRRRFGIQSIYKSYSDMIEYLNLDVVHILTPPNLHAEMAIEAMRRNCHVLVEKPMALSYEEAAAMAKTSKEMNKRLAVCEIYLFDPVVIKARRMVERGLIGKIIHVEAYWFTDISGDSHAYSMKGNGSGWAYDLPGGVFANFLDHPAYLQRAFLGEIDSVKVFCSKIGSNPFVPYDEMRIHLTANDKTGYIVASLNGKPRINILRLYGTEGILTVDMSNMTITTARNRHLPSFMAKGVNNVSQSYELARDTILTTSKILMKKIKAREGLRALIKEFYESLNSKGCDLLSAEKASETTQILTKIWESVEIVQQQEVWVNDMKAVYDRCGFAKEIPESDKRQRVLVTGGGGFVGSQLIKELLRKHYIVRLLTRKVVKLLGEVDNVEVIYGDIRNAGCVDKAAKGVSAIYHLAAIASNKGTWERFKETNIDGTRNLLNSATKYGVSRFVFVSSVAVYGFNKRKKMINEGDGYGNYFSKYSYYAKSKAKAEELVMSYYREKSLPTVILRPGVIFGPGGKNIFARSKIIFGAKRKVLPYIYVKNVVDAFVLAGTSDNAVGKTYNVVDDEQPTQGNFRKKIKRVADLKDSGIFLPVSIMYIPAVLLEQLSVLRGSDAAPPFGIFHFRSIIRNLRYDNKKIKDELGWQPVISIEEGLKETFEHFYGRVKF